MPGREVACDESGYEGDRLVGGVTDVFAHAGTVLDAAGAAACVAELRRRIRSPAQEYKANHLLRAKHRGALLWLLGPSGPVLGRAHVLLVDKTFLVVRRTVAALAADGTDPRAVHAAGRASPPAAWAAFLAAADAVTRGPGRAGRPPDARATVLAGLRALGVTVDAERPVAAPDDLLVPAIARAAARWGGPDGGPVTVVHDRQTALTADRLAAIGALAGRPVDVRLVASADDPRVQVADFLAGVAYRVASGELAGHGDAELVALLRPYVDGASTWGDPRSWAALTGPPAPVTAAGPPRRRR